MGTSIISIIASVAVFYFYRQTAYFSYKTNALEKVRSTTFLNLSKTQKNLITTQQELTDLKNQDQYMINKELAQNIFDIESTYKNSVSVYEQLLKLKELAPKIASYDASFTHILTLLSQKNYASAEATISELTKNIQKKRDEIVSTFAIPANVASSNSPPTSGYTRQKVSSEVGEFLVDIIAADLNSTRVIVDTASDSSCGNDCPALSLADYVGRSGAFAGINGPYFCPATYPSCAGKTNSFDTLLMNKNKVYFNSDNNVYSVVPAVIFSGSSARFVSRSLEWGRDGGVDSVIASQPLLVLDNTVVYGGDSEIKRAGKGARSFIGSTGNIVYIGVVHNANVAEAARVLKALGISNALNLDSGGSTALWNGRYLVGPGRNTPFGILLVRK